MIFVFLSDRVIMSLRARFISFRIHDDASLRVWAGKSAEPPIVILTEGSGTAVPLYVLFHY
jgi:hypothetical protein